MPFSKLVSLMVLAAMSGCGDTARLPVADGTGPSPSLPPPNPSLITTVNIAPAVGWPDGLTPVAAPGLVVTALAGGLSHPRWLYVLPNGDVLVAETNAPPKPDDARGLVGWFQHRVQAVAGAGEPSADRITLLRVRDGAVQSRSVFLDGLHSPFGMALVGRDLYVADTDALLRFPYQPGQIRITGPGVTVTDLPAGRINHHWTKNVIASPDGQRLYVAVGSNSNVGDNGMAAEEGRAAIWEVDPQTGGHRVFASGLRNPVGLAWEPETGALWTAVNERDEIGSDLVPDYMTAVRDGGFYGWPYSYYGQHVDARAQPPRPDLVARAIAPDYALGAHTASLGLAFSRPGALPPALSEGAFVGQHGSWNRRPKSGYKVVFVPFREGRPAGEPIEILAGFLDNREQARGRPVGVALDGEGALLVADDVGDTVWRITASSGSAARLTPEASRRPDPSR